jgi:hypothetical protein
MTFKKKTSSIISFFTLTSFTLNSALARVGKFYSKKLLPLENLKQEDLDKLS